MNNPERLQLGVRVLFWLGVLFIAVAFVTGSWMIWATGALLFYLMVNAACADE